MIHLGKAGFVVSIEFIYILWGKYKEFLYYILRQRVQRLLKKMV